MADEALQRLFLELGYKIDTASQAKFEGAITRSTALGVAMGTALVGAAKEAVSYFDKASDSLEKLYFTSKRTGASATEIQNFSMSLQNAGASAESVHATLENLARFQRTSFAANPILQSLGVSKKDLGDAKKELDDIFAWAKRTYHADTDQLGYAEAFARISTATNGAISEDVFQAAMHPDKDGAETTEQIAKRIGVDWDNAAKNAHTFNDEMRVIGAEVESKLLPTMESFYQISVNAAAVFHDLIDGVNGKPMSDALQKLGAPKTAADVLASPATLLNAASDFTSNPTWNGLSKLTQAEDSAVMGVLQGVGHAAYGAGIGIADIFSNGHAADDPKTKQAMAWFMSSAGGAYSQAQAAGLVSNLFDESKLNAGATGDSGNAHGLAQWHPDRIAAIMQGTGIDVTKAGYADQLKAVTWELHNSENAADVHLRGNNNANAAGADVSRYYERPAGGELSAAFRGVRAEGLDRSTSTNQQNIKIDVHTQPGADAKQIGTATATAIRNMTPAAQ